MLTAKSGRGPAFVVKKPMLIPSIDLRRGKVVQLIQGETLAIESSDLEGWIERFARFPAVQLIDLDAAMGMGTNDEVVRQIATKLPCRVGGGVRSVGRAEDLLAAGAKAVIVGSAFFDIRRSAEEGVVKHDFARALADAVGIEHVIGAVDAKGGRVVIHGWKTVLPITPVQAVKALEPYCGEFLYTHVDKEGLMQGTDMEAIRAVASATPVKVTAAGGISTREEIDALQAMGIDAVVGMAIYTGTLNLETR
jgi:phosphoribosylformimino-5-aminoimidazole carboxamide ribotide isomerase